MANRATDPGPLNCAKFQFVLDKGQHPMLIEMTIKINMGIVPTVHLELTAGFCRGGINADGFQSLEVFLTPIGIYDVESPIPAVEPVFDKWKEDAVCFLRIVKKSTDMTLVAELGAGEVNGPGFGANEKPPRCIVSLRRRRIHSHPRSLSAEAFAAHRSRC